jgi:hypothetical protein
MYTPHHLSDAGESFDYLRSDVRNLSRYIAELEALLDPSCVAGLLFLPFLQK